VYWAIALARARRAASSFSLAPVSAPKPAESNSAKTRDVTTILLRIVCSFRLQHFLDHHFLPVNEVGEDQRLPREGAGLTAPEATGTARAKTNITLVLDMVIALFRDTI